MAKITVWNLKTGKSLDVESIDASEICKSDEYSMNEPGKEPQKEPEKEFKQKKS